MWFSADFGAAFAGIGTVGYTEYNRTGAVEVARTTAGVVEIGNGVYGVDVIPDTDTVEIQWDTGGASPVYATQEIENFAVILLRNRIDTNPTTGIYTVYDHNGAVIYTGNIYEDVAATQQYQNKGINRKDRLT